MDAAEEWRQWSVALADEDGSEAVVTIRARPQDAGRLENPLGWAMDRAVDFAHELSNLPFAALDGRIHEIPSNRFFT